jgi:tRNA-dihydrouridine synthase B
MSLLKPVRIGTLVTRNNVFVAPLAGISDTCYRIIGRRFGAGLTFTEMVSAHGLVKRNQKTIDLLRISRKERPSGIQLFGSVPEIMSEAASILSDFTADLIDINGGCSVKKVLKTGAGAKLLGNPETFYSIVQACVNASIYPVSVKIRLGLSEDRINVLENAIAAQEAGASLLTLHPRTAQSKYSGKARWEYIAEVKSRLGIPVCGNGDIRTPEDAVRMIVETGCDAVMIGRAAIGNPWLFRDIVEVLDSYPNCPPSRTPTYDERIRLAVEHLHAAVSAKGEVRGVREVRRHIHQYLRSIPYSSRVRDSVFKIESLEELQEKLESLLILDQH